MSFADSFRSLDFLEQAQALQELQAKPADEAIAELLPLFTTPIGDTAADSMVRSSLRAMLQQDDALIIDGLGSKEQAYAALCLEMAGSRKLAAAVPALQEKALTATDPEALQSTLAILGSIGTPETLPLLRHHAGHEDAVVAALCIQYLGSLGDEQSIGTLASIIRTNNAEDRYNVCEITTWKAIEALGDIGTKGSADALRSLIEFIHHNNPAARRIVQETLVRCGEISIPMLAPALLDPDIDSRIMAANALRDINHKAAADPLIKALEHGAAVDANVGFAIYEALGQTPGVKSLVALTDALPKEAEPSTLMAVVQALEALATPMLGKRMGEIVTDRMSAHDPQAQRILQAVIAAHAIQLFLFLYTDPVIGRLLMGLLFKCDDPKTMAIFLNALGNATGPHVDADMKALQAAVPADAADRPKLLAIDDSTAMRSFYRTHGAAIGFDVTLAEHGREALDIVEGQQDAFDVVVVDMNMPVMDGIQFTEKLRAMPAYAKTPVIMATTESGRSQATLARQCGVSSFLPKPFTPEMLQNKLGKILERSNG